MMLINFPPVLVHVIIACSMWIKHYWLKKDSNLRKISKYLSSTQSLREAADYDAVDDIDETIANDCINKAEEFMNEAKIFIIIWFFLFVFEGGNYSKIFAFTVCK